MAAATNNDTALVELLAELLVADYLAQRSAEMPGDQTKQEEAA